MDKQKISAKKLASSLTKDEKVINSMKAIQRAGFWSFVVAVLTPITFIMYMIGSGEYQSSGITYLYLAFTIYLAIIGLKLNRLEGPIVIILVINILLSLGFLGGIFPIVLVIMSVIALAKIIPYYEWRNINSKVKN